MITDHQGKYGVLRTREELLKQIQKEMKNLNAQERATLELVLAEMSQQDQTNNLLSTISTLDYKHVPVDMHTFIYDPYYLGNTCDMLYPKWEEALTNIFEGGYSECVFTGSIGCGKTFAASIGICRVLYEISCLKNPHKTFGIAKDSNISLICFSVNETLAIKVAFENIANKIKASPYFQENFKFEDTKKELRFPGNVWVAARATNDTSALGLNAIGCLLDEGNFYHTVAKEAEMGIANRAETIYNLIKRRMKSRFEKQGMLPGKLFIVSSKNTNEDFTAKRLRESKDDPTVYVADFSLWDVKRENYSAETFDVLVGTESMPSKVLSPVESAELKAKRPDLHIIEAPLDFKTDFERDCDAALRDLAGVATVSINPYISRREAITENIDRSRIHPYTSTVLDPGKPGRVMWERLVSPVRERGAFSGAVEMNNRPILHPRAIRHAHIDQSLRNDATGLCIAHVGEWIQVMRRGDDGKEYAEQAPVIYVDFMLRIVPPTGGELVLGEFRQVIYDFVAHGYSIHHVTMDTWQSVEPIQVLQRKGFSSEALSVDKTPDPYEQLKTALYEKRVRYYEYEPLFEELRTLERHVLSGRRVKIDHPKGGRKDVADALAAVVYSLSQKAPAPLPVQRGPGYGVDAWMPEQVSAQLGGNPQASTNVPLMPFISGRGGGGGWDDGGGWNNF